MYRTTNVPVHYLCTGTFVHKSSTEHLCKNGWRIFWTSVCYPFVHKWLTNISDVHLLSICAQTVDRYIGTKRKRKFNESQENNILGKCKQLSQEKKSNIGPIHWTANGQQTVVRCFSVQTVAWADLYPFAVRTSDVRLLSKTFCCVVSCEWWKKNNMHASLSRRIYQDNLLVPTSCCQATGRHVQELKDNNTMNKA